MLNEGDKISNYTLERYLGKGSYGEVWLAKKSIELSDDGILVALKFLGYQPQKDKTQEDFVRQVKREVGTWIKASGYKNIVSVQDGFAFRDDTFVIVSDFAEGGSLSDWLQANGGKSPSLEKTVEIMSEILDGLAHLHSQKPDKIIHRDLKPDNVLFKSGVPCITDFGVSRMSQTITQSMAQVAATSAGTPLYMSPESFNNQPASRSMDIWSAGVILYQMCSGNFPFYGDNPISLALEIISERPPKLLSTDVPQEFQAIIAKSLEKDVSLRFQTAEDMKASLREALEGWKSSQYQVTLPKVTNAIIDKFAQTEKLNIQPTENWQNVDAEKRRQDKLAETQKLQKTEEATVISITEAQRQQAELSQIRRNLASNSQPKSKRHLWLIGLVASLFSFILLGSLIFSGFGIWGNSPTSPTISNINTIANSNKTKTVSNIASPTISNINTITNRATTDANRTLTEVSLPNGTKLQAYPGGIEDQLVKFIQSDEYKNGTAESLKAKWFNFDDLNFKTGSSASELVAESQRQVDNIVAILKAFPDVKIKIGGYTDKTGDDAKNKKLSDDRAKAVKAKLEAAGVGAQVPEAEGYGEEQAKVPETASDEERKADRKTAVRLIK